MIKTKRLILNITTICLLVLLTLPVTSKAKDSGNDGFIEALTDSITRIVSSSQGEIGVALIIDNRDTVTVNNRSVYPMMSVFKMHQALAVCDRLDKTGDSLDSIIHIKRDELDAETWSPMMKEHSEPEIALPIRELLRYAIIQSDNNASNIMFERLVNIAETDAFITRLIPHSSFKIAFTESEMSKDHDKAYSNFTSPLGAAMLINRVFNDSLVSTEKQEFIKTSLRDCVTGQDRIAAPLNGCNGVEIAHKTGSGYRNAYGILAAHNDVGFIMLPSGTRYALAVFVKDFKGDESQASQVIACISAAVYSLLSGK